MSQIAWILQYLQWMYSVSLLSIGLLYVCLVITSDYRARRRYWDQCAEYSNSQIRTKFRERMFFLAVYIQRKHTPQLPRKSAAASLVQATVLRERICMLAGLPGPRSYLKSRKELWRVAKDLEVPQAWAETL